MGRAWVVAAVALLTVGCARSPCGDAPCRRAGGSTCADERTVLHTTSLGWCDDAQATCAFAEPRERACPAATRCETGACVCVPAECDGCCGTSECFAGDLDDRCGLAGEQCVACGPSAICQAGRCEPCPPLLVARRGRCVSDDTGLDVELPPWALASEFGDTIVVWDWSVIPETVGTFSARADGGTLNDAGVARLALPLRNDPLWQHTVLTVTAPSGRTRQVHVHSIRSRAIGSEPSDCRLTRDRTLACASALAPVIGEPLVDVSLERVLTSSGRVIDFAGNSPAPRFTDVGIVVRVSSPCALTLEGRVWCDDDEAPAWEVGGGPWRQVECRQDACCALSALGRVWCWGYHTYDLFAPVDSTGSGGQAQPGTIPRLPGVYRQLASAPKTYFARDQAGAWWTATRNIILSTPSGGVPFVLEPVGTDAVHLDSPYYDVLALHTDGSLAVHAFKGAAVTRLVVPAYRFLDVAAHSAYSSSALALTTDLRFVSISRPYGDTFIVIPVD